MQRDPDSPVTNTPATPDSPSSSAPAGAPIPADLTVSVDDGSGTTSAFTLTCVPEVGSTPTPRERAVPSRPPALRRSARPRRTRCAPSSTAARETATVKGTLDGQPVSAEFSRTDGCQIGRWDLLSALFGAVGGADS